MARLARLSFAHYPHHILQCGNDNRLIFIDTADVDAFRQLLLEASQKYQVAIHSYVFMPNHLHLLATPAKDGGIGLMMQWIGRHYVPYFNKRHQRTGTLWQGRFKSLVIEASEYFLFCMRYIETNPVRSGLALNAADYAHINSILSRRSLLSKSKRLRLLVKKAGRWVRLDLRPNCKN